jgi:biotin operon repressor
MSERRRAPFNELHRDLDRALALCGLSPAEQAVMVRARELSYAKAKIAGSDDALAFDLGTSEISETFDFSRSAISKAIGQLTKATILRKGPDGYRINKRFEAWQDPHRLSPKQINACCLARRTLNVGSLRNDDQRAHDRGRPTVHDRGRELSTIEGAARPRS